MKAGYIVGTVLETIIKVVVIAGVVLFAFKGASQAYDFGYRVLRISLFPLQEGEPSRLVFPRI